MGRLLAGLLVLGLLGASASAPTSFGQDAASGKGEKKRKPKFTVGKETTYVKGPLTRDGYVDFPTALNQRLGQGVTPQTNANVLLWQAFGPHPERSTMPPEFFKWLGIKAPPERGEYFINITRYVVERLRLRLDEQEGRALHDQMDRDLDRAAVRPWTAKQYPHLAAWLKANEKPLALVVAASKRPHYFAPLVPKGDVGLLYTFQPALVPCRESGSALAARAMLRVGEGRSRDAWQDLLACHRLGRLVARGTVVEGLIGMAIDGLACDVVPAYLSHARLSAGQLKDCLRDLQRLPPIPQFADRVDLADRFQFLDAIMLLARRGPDAFDGKRLAEEPSVPGAEERERLDRIDWDPALRDGNRWYDRIVAAMRLKDRRAREKQLAKLNQELSALKGKAGREILAQALLMVGPTPQTIGKAIGEVLIGLLVPAFDKLPQWNDRAEQTQRNLHVAFALAAYKQEHGRYPAKLEALGPKYLAQIPGDLFSGKPLIYRPTEKGYLLYSVGVNGKDEQGRSDEDDPPGDDLAVRMPLPALRRN
jgi:hypothetical protein